MEWSPPMVAALASSFPSRIMVLFSRLEHFRANSNASIQHRPKKKQMIVMEMKTARQYFIHFFKVFRDEWDRNERQKVREKKTGSRTMDRDSGWKRLDFSSTKDRGTG